MILFFPLEGERDSQGYTRLYIRLAPPFPQDWVVITEGGRLHKDVSEEENTVIAML